MAQASGIVVRTAGSPVDCHALHYSWVAPAEDLDYCARLDSVDVVPLQTESGLLKAAILD